MLQKHHKHLIIVDGYAIIFRAFYAMPELKNKDGLYVGAIHGTIRLLLSILKGQKDIHLVVALDGAEMLFREEVYSGYKANRSETPESLVGQFDIFEEALKSMGIPYCRVNGYEADDIIATFAKVGKKNNLHVTVVSGDKDLMQLIDDGVHYFHLFQKKYISYDDVVTKFGVPPKMLCDYLSLVGDKVDNIPGVVSIGSKTASELICEYGGIEEIYSNIEKVSNLKKRKTLQDNRDVAFLSKRLVALDDEIDSVPALEDLCFIGIKENDFMEFLEKYHLKNIIRSLSPEVKGSKKVKTDDVKSKSVEKKDKALSSVVQNSFDF